MVRKNKIYTKEEFKKLLKTENIGEYFTNINGRLLDYYICGDNALTEKQCQLLDDGKLGLFEMANYDQLGKIETEACARVWFDRSSVGTDSEPAGIPEEIRQQALKEQQRIIEEYDIDPAECDDFYHGYWSGILALCRYLSLGSQVNIDDLRSGNGLLDD